MYSTMNIVRDVWKYVRPYKGQFWLATAAEVVGDIVFLYPTYGLAVIISFFTTYSAGADLSEIYSVFGLIILATITSYASFYVAGTTTVRLSEQMGLDVESEAMRHMATLDIAWHEKESAGGKFKRIERGGTSTGKLLRLFISDLLDVAITLVGTVAIVFQFDTTVAVAIVIFLATFYAIRRTLRMRGVAFVDIVNKKEEKRSGIMFEAISNIRSVKLMSMMPTIARNLATNAADLMKSIEGRIFWMRGGNTASNFYAQMFRILMMAFIVWGIVKGEYGIALLVLFNGYFGHLWNSITRLADISEEFAIAKSGMERLHEIMVMPVTIDEEKGKKAFPVDWQAISIRNLSFSYRKKPVLSDVSFEVKRGEKIGIVGLSGAGKSTLFKLLMKEYESYSGEISFDGVPLTTISKRDYFRHLAVVLQDTELFNTSLKENIMMTNETEAKNKTLFDAAVRIAHVRDFMKKLPEGADSVIGEKGVKLSGGEKQRVGIARAIFKKPQILLLDEATAHLDIESEEKIRDSLHAFFRNVTAIVIAHRLTTIKEMDRIIVMEGGKIIESGSFTELHAKGGRFFELWEKQNL